LRVHGWRLVDASLDQFPPKLTAGLPGQLIPVWIQHVCDLLLHVAACSARDHGGVQLHAREGARRDALQGAEQVGGRARLHSTALAREEGDVLEHLGWSGVKVRVGVQPGLGLEDWRLRSGPRLGAGVVRAGVGGIGSAKRVLRHDLT
jgi:hypothetical protein